MRAVRTSFALPAVKASWSRDDIQALRSLAEQGLPITSIAKLLGRSESAVRNKATMHGVSLYGDVGEARLQLRRNAAE